MRRVSTWVASARHIYLKKKASCAFISVFLAACGGGGSLPSDTNAPSSGTTNGAPDSSTDFPSSRAPGDPAPRQASTARFKAPHSLTFDASGNLYITDSGNYVIRKITPDGRVTKLAGTSGVYGVVDGDASTAQFYTLDGIALDKLGNVYVVDGNAIRKVSASGIVSTVAGNVMEAGYIDGAGMQARFNQPSGIAFDQIGNLLVADSLNNAIRSVTPEGQVSTVTVGTTLIAPQDVAVDSTGSIYIADYSRIIRSFDGTATIFAGRYTSDSPNEFDGVGNEAAFFGLAGIALSSGGTLYVSEATMLGPCGGTHSVIRSISPDRVVTTIAGKPMDACRPGGGADGTGMDARFYFPRGLAVDPYGNIVVADTLNHAIRKITPIGVVTTIAGKLGEQGYAD